MSSVCFAHKKCLLMAICIIILDIFANLAGQAVRAPGSPGPDAGAGFSSYLRAC